MYTLSDKKLIMLRPRDIKPSPARPRRDFDEYEPCETPEEPIRKAAIGDLRLFSNSLAKLITTLQNSGIDAASKKYENDKYIEYRVRIPKAAPAAERCKQLKIC